MKLNCICSIRAAVLTAVLFGAPPAVADVAFIAILEVPEQNFAAFDDLAGRMVEVSAEDDGLLVYEFARVGTTVYGYERYTNEAAHDRHEALIAPFLSELTGLAEFKEIVTLTPLSEGKADAFAAIGARIGSPVAGVAQGQLDD